LNYHWQTIEVPFWRKWGALRDPGRWRGWFDSRKIPPSREEAMESANAREEPARR
jgi:hypothetical protein